MLDKYRRFTLQSAESSPPIGQIRKNRWSGDRTRDALHAEFAPSQLAYGV